MSRLASSDDTFRAVADPTRRQLLDILADGERPMMELAGRFDMSVPAVSQHLRVLREADLVRERPQGRLRIYSIAPKPLRIVSDWVSHYQRFWEEGLDALGAYVAPDGGDFIRQECYHGSRHTAVTPRIEDAHPRRHVRRLVSAR